jgi:heat shock protein HspQ
MRMSDEEWRAYLAEEMKEKFLRGEMTGNPRIDAIQRRIIAKEEARKSHR